MSAHPRQRLYDGTHSSELTGMDLSEKVDRYPLSSGTADVNTAKVVCP